VPCLDENTIVAFHDAQLSLDDAARVDAHLANCTRCRRLLAAYAATATPADLTAPRTAASGARDDRVDLGQRLAYAHAKRREGTVLCGKWTLERLLGMGGMALVFAARHKNGRAVAVKILRPELVVEPLVVERFLREGYVANKVGHAGAVAILDEDVSSDGAPFLVLELLSGRTLRERLHEGPLRVAEALRVVEEVLDVLAAAHDHGIVHRDVKPDNLFETDDGTIKVLDFGIARLRESLGNGSETRTGTALGTIGYISPEQARGLTDLVDARSDLWSVGATLFTLLTGRILREAASTNEALLVAMTEPVPPVKTLAPAVPSDVCALLDRALAFDKAARFADAREMGEAVRALRTRTVAMAPPTWVDLEPIRIEASPPTTTMRMTSASVTASTRRSRGAAATALAVMGALGAVGVALFAGLASTHEGHGMAGATAATGSTVIASAVIPVATESAPSAPASPAGEAARTPGVASVAAPRAAPRPSAKRVPKQPSASSSAPAPSGSAADPLGPRF
jgi:serine/threonine-protein kinase